MRRKLREVELLSEIRQPVRVELGFNPWPAGTPTSMHPLPPQTLLPLEPLASTVDLPELWFGGQRSGKRGHRPWGSRDGDVAAAWD